MNDERKQEILVNLQIIIDNSIPAEEEQELTYFGLISGYNSQYDNQELIGGDFAKENGIKLAQ